MNNALVTYVRDHLISLAEDKVEWGRWTYLKAASNLDNLPIRRISLDEQEELIDELKSYPGIGKSLSKSISDACVKWNGELPDDGKFPASVAFDEASWAVSALLMDNPYSVITIAGSLNRKKDRVSDIDIVAATNTDFNSDVLKEGGWSYNYGGEVRRQYIKKVNGRDLKMDIRIVPSECHETAMLFYTGPAHFNINLRSVAKSKSMKLNEYGLFDVESEKLLESTLTGIEKRLGVEIPEPAMR